MEKKKGLPINSVVCVNVINLVAGFFQIMIYYAKNIYPFFILKIKYIFSDEAVREVFSQSTSETKVDK